jgi:NADPH2:quinone reductase
MPLGLMVSFGQSSGPVDPLPLGLLAQKGSLFVTRPTLASYIASRDELVAAADELFELVLAGVVTAEVRHTYDLADAARAHADLEGRRTSGSIVLLP